MDAADARTSIGDTVEKLGLLNKETDAMNRPRPTRHSSASNVALPATRPQVSRMQSLPGANSMSNILGEMLARRKKESDT